MINARGWAIGLIVAKGSKKSASSHHDNKTAKSRCSHLGMVATS